MSGRTSSPSSVDAVEEPAPVEVKKESPEDEIKEYAETAMNELLGWYGYEKLDRRDTEDLDLHHFASRRQIAGRGRSLRPHPPPNRPTRHTPRTKLPAPVPLPPPADPPMPSSPPKVKREASESPTETTPPGPSAVLEESSADASSSSPHSPASLPPTTSEALLCSWCGRAASSLPITAPSTTTTLSVRNGGSSSVTSTTTKAFCSEICFTQCRRASFKRSKACDWCRHVRHTVAYVDFQDGETQLQFCSDKCLNQYKMNIFCKETQAHLAQLKAEASASTPSTTTGPSLIITPDLWLRDCREVGEDGGREEEDEEEEDEEAEEAEGDPETSPRRQQRRTLSTDVPGSKPPEKKSKEHRRKKRRLSEEATPSIPPPVPPVGAPGAGPFQQVRHPAFVRVPRKTPTLPQRTPPGFMPPLPIPPAPPFLPPHFPPHVPLPILPPEAHFSRFLRPRAETLPTHVIPNGPSSLQPPPPRIPPAPQPPSLLPPVTMLVPYPIILPVPVPIPIPIPILGDALLKKISQEEREETEDRTQRPPASSPRSSTPSPHFPSSQEVSTHIERANQQKRPRGSSPEDDSPVVGSKRKFVPA